MANRKKEQKKGTQKRTEVVNRYPLERLWELLHLFQVTANKQQRWGNNRCRFA